MHILLAMSGGIDSSVVAFLLKEQGHTVTGVRFSLWSDPLAPAISQILPSKCCTTQNIARASSVAKALGIPLRIINLELEFKEQVVDPYLQHHKEGITPNPCIECNRTIKFGKLLQLAKELHCDKLATGHYARVVDETMQDGTNLAKLLQAVDPGKDQSYYLYGLTQEQLQSVLFPLGDLRKNDVYALAEHFGLPIADSYRESQDLCFFPEKTPQEFLKRHLQTALQAGDIVRRDGTVVGSHEGLPLYTVGQRRGLKIGGLKIPLEVVEKNVVKNQLIVSPKETEKTTEVELREVRFISWKPAEGETVAFDCRTRSLSQKKAGLLHYSKNRTTFRFDVPLSVQAPGQSLVLYRDEEVVGGGVMM